ncbi:Dabb family protein [Aestuariivirga litoralis]|uniref:Dabb family protein n=1 Tax=Aestuariivirga litoralis TaxID=2650924 RepID=UPI0018C5A55E|nr:Dabb family protein [Aestuariivirga litoralis]MBG1233159.1 Dabb family protein [Aestuariivirga litoralis]
MIRHVVLFKLRKDVPASTVTEIFTKLAALKGVIPGILATSAGADASPEGLQRGNSHGFTVDFTDAAARDAYLPHPAHQVLGGLIVASSEGGLSGITVLDWEYESTKD